MKIALFGATGQVGRELAKLLLAKEHCLKNFIFNFQLSIFN